MAASYEGRARRARLRLAVLGAAVVAALAAGGAVAITMLDNDGGPARADAKASPSPSTSTSPAPSASVEWRTPATSRPLGVLKPKRQTDGIGTGFEHSALGAMSAAVSYWEDLDLLDDVIARQQWSAIAASPAIVDEGVSEVRKLREGVGLPPSGGTPDGITFSTNVKAVLARSLEPTGDVVVVWMSYDRFATVKGKGADDNPLRDETTDLVLTWQDGDWKVTSEAKYKAKIRGPHAYDPASKYAWAEGWRRVTDG
ncbi:hypothetical protein K388_06933 [Streptomyces sp. KhCrAH-43]|uniref:hypothetical protein n=1 Tax=unclassified Streptomyces TaxID=2593676 RepID=UPI000DC5509C|nr:MULTISPECIES: hypothetical protein [unclassified Streptomyces]RAJ48667.1 hypothetical protein K388_06933 [Streptomyces sp. KhCrAH-43]